VFAAMVLVTTLGLLAASRIAIVKQSCLQPTLRREWRTLSAAEKTEYLRAVKCLHDLPSGLNSEGRLSDDFPWIHFNVGNYGKYSSFSYPQRVR
jgi:tyrosinase